ncbi:MAG: aminotransferase [Prevotellaceae bacterium]|jgi:spore coat polysaccharide biosynthesis protein SpsF|nr:aminotransferase [Prevotellaceae bacterium]
MTHPDGIILQARTGSTRLPHKILLPFYGSERIIDILIHRIKETCPTLPLILATTTRGQDDVLADIARQAGIGCFRGDEEDVLARFIGAAEQFNLRRIVRVCSDNPFLCADTFAAMLAADDAAPADYTAYATSQGKPTIQSHLGLFAELTTLDALRRAAAATRQKRYTEHVTIYLYTHPEQFTLQLLPLPDELKQRTDLRFTLDTAEDFSLLQMLYARWREHPAGASVQTLLELVQSHEEWLDKMKENIQKNQK